MFVEKYDGSEKRRVIGAMINDDIVIARIMSQWTKDLFPDDASNRMSYICKRYYDDYKRAPKDEIISYVESWCEKRKPDRVLHGLLDAMLRESLTEWKPNQNSDYLIKQTSTYLTRVKLEKTLRIAEAHTKSGRLDDAIDCLREFNKIGMTENSGTFLFNDKAEVISTFDEIDGEVLIRYPDGLGEFFLDSLCRDGFVSFMGPEKSGKSWWLIDMAIRGLENRKRVAFFSIGDMSRRQIKKRFLVRNTRMPLRAGKYSTPISLEPGKVVHREKEYKALDRESAWKACEHFLNSTTKSDIPPLYLSTHLTGTINVSGIRSELEDLRRTKDWCADVIVIDYADILAPPTRSSKMDKYEKINQIWMELRSLSLEHNCLLVTATQTNRKSYTEKSMGMHHVSEHKSKLAHVTGMVGINAIDEEKMLQMGRLNWVNVREMEGISKRHCWTAGCLALAHPSMLSAYVSKADLLKKRREEEPIEARKASRSDSEDSSPKRKGELASKR
jgi:hypothetical protein